MNTSTVKYVIPMFIVVFIAVLGLSSNLSISKNADIQNASLDLATWDSSDFLLLNGEWTYYPNALKDEIQGLGEQVIVPHFWEISTLNNDKPYGYATYELHLTGLDPEKSYAFQIENLGMAYNLYVNNRLIMQNGIVSKNVAQFVPEWKSIVSMFNPDDTGSVHVIVEIANFNYDQAGFWNSIQMGDAESITSEHHERLLIESIMFGFFATLGLFFILLNALSNQEKKSLHLGVFSMLIALRILFTGHKIILGFTSLITWEMMIRADYLFAMLLLPVFGFLMYRLDYIRPPNWTKYISYALCFFIVIFAFTLPIHYYLVFFDIWTYIMVVIAIYFFYMLIKSIKRKVDGILFMFLIVIMMGIVAVIDLFYGLDDLYLYYSSFIFISYIAIMVADDFLTVKKKQLSLENRIVIDPLTSVYNRLYLNQLLDHGYTKTKDNLHTYVLFVDLNGFKETNDQYGHLVGDEILVTIASRLQYFVSKHGVVIRYGGDEFILIIDLEDTQNIDIVMKELHKLIENKITIFSQDYLMTAAIGYSIFDHEITLDDAIRLSDTHMYKNKSENISHIVKYHD
jgi:diguanylate cyclase (GGDEF)-like protein